MKIETTKAKNIFLKYSPIIALALLLFCAWLLFDKFKKQVKPIIPLAKTEKVIIDSINSQHNSYKDSVKKEAIKQKLLADSLKRVNNELSEKFKQSVSKVVYLSTQVSKAKVEKDTNSYYLNCDSLAAKTVELKDESEAKERSYAKEKEFIEADNFSLKKQIEERDNVISSLQGSNKNLIVENLKVTREKNKLEKKNGRRFGIGPSISYVLAEDLKLHAGVGISLTYRFINFKL